MDDSASGVFAHSPNERNEWHLLVDHLRGASRLAADFAQPLGASDLAKVVGLWHDLGKFHPDWQNYLRRSTKDPTVRTRERGRHDHKAAGAMLATQHLPLAALLIQGHHGGLRTPDAARQLIRDHGELAEAALALARAAIPDLVPAESPDLPSHLTGRPRAEGQRASELFLRLVFSALVDADFLDTEMHFNAAQAAVRGSAAIPAELFETLRSNQEDLARGAPQTAVNEARAAIYEACLDAAEKPPGIFRLTVPTGGGKTRSGLAFALKHAKKHGQQRVVVAVPYLSITEQTAQTYRQIFGDGGDDSRPIILEHHSAASEMFEEHEGGEFEPGAEWRRLAAENWDAPIIVTTTVQLLESLFSNRTGRTRKLHRLANSVIILDEAQALPAHLLEPALDVLRELAAHYGTTIVLSTATQPAFEVIPAFASVEPVEIVPEPGHWFEALRRVKYEWRLDPAVGWDEVARWITDEPERRTLTVVNTKKDAFALLDALELAGVGGLLHLSTTLCGAHRQAVIAQLKSRLDAGEPCHLVSTQVIEAGVDLDFPVVYRALAPLDSIIQAAGRCNREGNLPGLGRTVVFRPADGGTPPGSYRTATGTTRSAIAGVDDSPDSPAVLERYFRLYLGALGNDGTDREKIQERRQAFDYPEVARRFQLIDDDTEAVIVTTYGTSTARARVQRWIEELRFNARAARYLLRRLQPFTVAIRKQEAARFRSQALLQPVMEGVGVWLGDYDEVRGLVPRGLGPDDLVV